MNTTNTTREQISAFADNELEEGHAVLVLAALRQQNGRKAWDEYHQIGDALRSDELDITLSAGFSERMFARLDAEPTLMMPAVKRAVAERKRSLSRFAVPGMAAAAVAVVAFLAMPDSTLEQSATLAKVDAPVVATVAAVPETVSVASQDGEILRDPRIDDYLSAHQRFSPSVYSTAQYARSATFAVDSEK